MAWAQIIPIVLSAIGTANSVMSKPGSSETAAQPTGQQSGQQNPMNATPPLNPQASVNPIDVKPLQDLASSAARAPQPAAQPAPVQNQQQQPVGPPVPSEDPIAQAMKNEQAWKSVLAAAPAAMAMLAPFMGGDQGRTIALPPVGGNGGSSAFQMPVRRQSLGEVLASLRI